METKPYNLQSPEQIAKDYGGNKQKIAEAMQMGIVDPTAGTMAGMFIDRMRSAAQMEAAPQQTVAQQVFAPPAPVAPGSGAMPQGGMQPPAPAPAGLGATPEAAMMAEQMPAPAPEMPPQEMPPQEMPPQEMPMMAEGGMVPPYMSGSGISDLPLPDDMFDESRNGGFNDGYAGGGLIAFARAGPVTDDEAWGRIKRLEGGLGPKGEMRVSSAGAVGPAQLMPDTAPEAARIAGLPWDEKRYRTDPAYNEALGKAYYLSRVSARGGDYNKAALDYHTGMGNVDKGKIGPAGRDYLRKFSGAELPSRDINTTEGQVASAEDIFGRLQERFGPSAEERASRAKLMARAEELTSDEYQNKMRKDSLWETLAAIGFNMASSKSPSLLQAVGEAAAAALPGASADKKERKALKDRGLELMVELGAKDRKDAIPLWNMATEAAKTNMSQQQFVEKQKLDVRQVDLAERKLKFEIEAARAGGDRISFDELLAAQVMAGEISEPMAEALLLRRGGAEGGGQTKEDIRAKVQAGRTGNSGAAAPTVIDFKNLTQP
jgi:hypothetical protein